MAWYGWVATGLLSVYAIVFLYAIGLRRWDNWMDSRAAKTFDKRFADKHGIDLRTTYAHFLPGERLP